MHGTVPEGDEVRDSRLVIFSLLSYSALDSAIAGWHRGRMAAAHEGRSAEPQERYV